ncbi:hypothetical protein IFM61606_00353 [Aspergillus udagawae]|nr:hypothetical protein IFM61606_00353 [Aspergillus udagawae]GFG20445.1 hypothetical protein IFM5058_10624 [Aspergillus udagawae]
MGADIRAGNCRPPAWLPARQPPSVKHRPAKAKKKAKRTVEKDAVIKKVWNCNARRAALFASRSTTTFSNRAALLVELAILPFDCSPYQTPSAPKRQIPRYSRSFFDPNGENQDLRNNLLWVPFWAQYNLNLEPSNETPAAAADPPPTKGGE